jgi:hypothetical protein
MVTGHAMHDAELTHTSTLVGNEYYICQCRSSTRLKHGGTPSRYRRVTAYTPPVLPHRRFHGSLADSDDIGTVLLAKYQPSTIKQTHAAVGPIFELPRPPRFVSEAPGIVPADVN